MKTQNDPNTRTPEDWANELTPTEQALKYNIGPESESERLSNGAVKGMAWLLGIVGVFALAILIAWACNINRSPLDAYMASSEAALKQPVVTAPAPAKAAVAKAAVAKDFSATATAAQTAANTVAAATATTTNAAALPATAVTTDAQTATAATPAALTPADNDRIEKEALEVLHGDYGNNPSRAQKLGADYALVQARVNQLLHS